MMLLLLAGLQLQVHTVRAFILQERSIQIKVSAADLPQLLLLLLLPRRLLLSLPPRLPQRLLLKLLPSLLQRPRPPKQRPPRPRPPRPRSPRPRPPRPRPPRPKLLNQRKPRPPKPRRPILKRPKRPILEALGGRLQKRPIPKRQRTLDPIVPMAMKREDNTIRCQNFYKRQFDMLK